jgi:hypothetical protein
MDDATRTHWNNLRTEDGDVRYAAFMALLASTDQPVDWAYEVWDELLANLRHPNNHQRAIAAQLLCNLAQSDPEQRMLQDIDALFAVTRDARFVTARHALQAIWKVALVGPQHQQLVVNRLADRFRSCVAEKNSRLIRYDMIVCLRKISDALGNAAIRETALTLIATEEADKYRKKYTAVWRSP